MISGGWWAIQPLCSRGLPVMEMVSEPLFSREEMPLMKMKNGGSTGSVVIGKSTLNCNSYPIKLVFWTSYLPFYPINLFPNPLLTISSLIKMSASKEMLRPFLRVPNLPFSKITGHLNNMPIKIQFLSLLIGSSSDRQHKLQLLYFQVHLKPWNNIA